MAEKSSFFNSVAGDRKYQASDFAEYFSKFITNGFFPGDLNLKVVSNGDMTVKVRSGSAWINGYMYTNTADLPLTIATADGVLNRVDRIVVQLDMGNRTINAKVKQGTSGSAAVPPTLQRDADVYELGIATINIQAGATSISQANIVDTRNDVTVGGIVNNLFAESTAEAKNVSIDDLNSYFVSTNLEGALIELKQPLSVYKSGLDDAGKFTVVEWKNRAGVTVKKSALSNVDADGNYLRRTVTLYAQNGTTVMNTLIYELTYNPDGFVTSEVLV